MLKLVLHRVLKSGGLVPGRGKVLMKPGSGRLCPESLDRCKGSAEEGGGTLSGRPEGDNMLLTTAFCELALSFPRGKWGD